jgi:hypothetical protein
MMQFGAFAFSLVKKNQQKTEKIVIEEYIVFSTIELHLNLNKKITYCKELHTFNNDFSSNIELIFDVDSFSFKEIIEFMEKNKATNITFKNYIKKSDYIIGSNNSNDRGEVIQVSNKINKLI